jgi:hypothetical protein
VIPLLDPTTCTDCPEPAIGRRWNLDREPSCENCEAERQAMIQLILGPGEEPQLDLTRRAIADLRAAAVATIPAGLEIGEWTLAWDTEDNRVRVYSPRPTSPERRAKQSEALRSRGFVWSRSAGAWQRQASARAWLLAQDAADEFAGVAPP